MCVREREKEGIDALVLALALALALASFLPPVWMNGIPEGGREGGGRAVGQECMKWEEGNAVAAQPVLITFGVSFPRGISLSPSLSSSLKDVFSLPCGHEREMKFLSGGLRYVCTR